MTPARALSRDRWARLEPLLDVALALDAPQRPAFLARTCGPDDSLRAELEALIDACERVDGPLDASAVATFARLLGDDELDDDDDDSPAAAADWLGDRYQVVREIGRGGMAVVYLAEDHKHGRQVAVKVLHPTVARAIGRVRFAREIDIVAALSHPHILPLHDSGAVASPDGGPTCLFFVSPYVAGESLRDRLHRAGALGVDAARALGLEIASALDYAHRQGVVHLDVKPGNILLQEGHAVVADFGIARAAMHSAPADHAPVVLGTPAYMSPEQALGAPDLDARSDVYSLGCVLYEMLTGAAPFADGTVRGALARAQVPVLPDRARLRERAGAALAAVVLRAMAPARDDRYATAAHVAHALGATIRPRRFGIGRRGVAAFAAAALACAAAATAWRRAEHAPALDADLVAVAPFDVESPALSLWHEGMMDVVARALDGAGALRSAPPSVVLRAWHGRADAASARALGEQLGARLVLYGGLVPAGDSVRATAVLLDVRTGQRIAELEARDVPERPDRIADSLSVALLRELGRARHTDVARATASPTTSLGALKAYLTGERYYRAARWDSAEVHFARAIALDTAFAMAYHRLAAVRRWRDPSAVPDSATYALMRVPSRFARGLGPRERLLVRIDSLVAETYFTWWRGMHDARARGDHAAADQVRAALTEAERRYPRDPELTLLHAEARWAFDWQTTTGEVDDQAILALFDRAIALDSSLAPAYVTPITLAASLDGAERARTYVRAYLAQAPAKPYPATIRLADALLDPARAARIDAARLVDTLPPDELCIAERVLRHVADSAETGVRIARAIAARPTGDSPELPGCIAIRAVQALAFRGHLREASRLAARRAHFVGPLATFDLARFGMVPRDSARAEFARIAKLAPLVTMTRLYAWWAADGDTAAIEGYLRAFTTMRAHDTAPWDAARLRANDVEGRAYLALARRDSATALRLFATTSDTLHDRWYENRLPIVELLTAAGRWEEAATRLERRWPGTSNAGDGVDDVLWTLARGRVLEHLGRRAEAAAAYDVVAAAWRRADAELQPYAREAAAASARLRGPSRGRAGA